MPGIRRVFPTEVIAHRGFSARAPENTLCAFREALRTRADRVEFDVLLTRDQVPVVIHDALLDRTTNGRGPVAELELARVRELDAGSWFGPDFAGERVPTLDEVLDLCAGRVSVNVEIKEEAVVRSGPGAGRVEGLVLEALQRRGLLGSTTISSFDALAVERLARESSAANVETLFTGGGRAPAFADLEAAKRVGCSAFNLSQEELAQAPGILGYAHELGLKVKVYTVDAPETMGRLLALGVDGIFTNRPDVLADLVFGLEEDGAKR